MRQIAATIPGGRAPLDEKQADRLMKARCRLMMREPWYGHVAMSMVWIPSQMPWMAESRRTMGVRIVNGGEIQCLYYPPFVETLNIKELYAVIQHEIEHIVRVHCIRIGDREPEAWNIAADMTVNGPRSSPRIGYPDPTTNELVIPFKNQIVWIPEDWAKDGTSEQYYDQLKKRQQTKVCNSCGRPTQGHGHGKGPKGQGQGQKPSQSNGTPGNANGTPTNGNGTQENGEAQTCPGCGQDHDGVYHYGEISGRGLDDHSIWNQSDVSHDEARQIVKDLVDQATQKCQGHYPGHLESAIQELGKPVVRWRELLRHYLGKHVGNQRSTYSRRNRRRDWFGMPGISHHAAANVNVIVDTSGSIGSRELEQFFAEIDAISSRAKTMVLQWDAAFQGYEKYRRGDWKKSKIAGRGGTNMAQPVEWLIQNNLVADVQIMLTDGYCNYTNASNVKFPMITVITTPEGTTSSPPYGHVVRMKVA